MNKRPPKEPRPEDYLTEEEYTEAYEEWEYAIGQYDELAEQDAKDLRRGLK